MARKPRPRSGKEAPTVARTGAVDSAGRAVRELTERLEFPDVLAPLPAGVKADYLLLASVRDEDIELLLPFPGDAEFDDTVQLLVDDVPTGDEVLVDPYLTPQSPIPLVLPAGARVSEGVRVLNYRIILHSVTGDILLGPSGQQFIADYTAPAGPRIDAPVFAAEVVADAVTPERLSTDDEGNAYLPGKVAAYFGLTAGDIVQGYIDGNVATGAFEVPVDNGSRDLELRFTRAALDSALDGPHDFTFDIRDRAGNHSVVSDPIQLTVRMKDLVADPLPPRVPAAADGLVNHAEAHATGGVSVDIPAHAMIQAGDTIIVTWAGYEASPRIVAAGDIGHDPLVSIIVPYDEVYAIWFGVTGGADTRAPAEVNYRIERGDVLAGKPDTPTTVQVNLCVPGGGDPDPETPEHDALAPPTVFSASGRENFIPVGERERDGVVEIPWASPVPDREVFRRGDIVTAHYGGDDLPGRLVDGVDMTAAIPLRIVLPAAMIVAAGSGTIAVTYTIRRPLAAGGFNEVTGPAREIIVETSEDQPGGGELAAGVFPEMNTHLTLGPAEIVGGTLFVGDYTDKAAGDTIRFEFVFVEGNPHFANEKPLDQRFHSATITLDSADAPVQYLIPEANLQYRDKPPERMHIHAMYYVSRPPFSEVPSPETFVYLDCRGEERPDDHRVTPPEKDLP